MDPSMITNMADTRRPIRPSYSLFEEQAGCGAAAAAVVACRATSAAIASIADIFNKMCNSEGLEGLERSRIRG